MIFNQIFWMLKLRQKGLLKLNSLIALKIFLKNNTLLTFSSFTMLVMCCAEWKQYVSALRKFRWWAEINFLPSVFLPHLFTSLFLLLSFNTWKETYDEVKWGKKSCCVHKHTHFIHSTLLKQRLKEKWKWD